MVLKRSRARLDEVSSSALAQAWNAQREREAVVSEKGGFQQHFHFNYGGGDWMRATSLQSAIICVESRPVGVKIFRGDSAAPYDEGRFVVDSENKTVIAEGFTRCFQQILGEPVKGIAASHLDVGDKIVLEGVTNGMYERARKGAGRGNPAILSIARPRPKLVAAV